MEPAPVDVIAVLNALDYLVCLVVSFLCVDYSLIKGLGRLDILIQDDIAIAFLSKFAQAIESLERHTRSFFDFFYKLGMCLDAKFGLFPHAFELLLLSFFLLFGQTNVFEDYKVMVEVT